LAQLSQRIAVLTGLKPLPVSETLQYIHHRLEIAGYDGPEMFTAGSVALITKASQGIPRNINNICFNAMSLACAMGCRRIGPEIVQEALNDLSLDCLVEKSGILRRRTPTLTSARQFSLGWLRDKVFTSRTVQTAVLSALLGGLATYLGAHTATGVAHSSAASLELESPAQRPATLAATHVDGSARAGRDSDASKFFTYVVQPDDTIWKLCQWSIGRYDETVVSELRKLNPQLSDVDRIEVGQQIRLPVRSPN
jgi:hypothetical protein